MSMNEEKVELSLLDRLLHGNAPNLRRDMPSAKIEVNRISDLFGAEFLLELRALTFDEIESIKESNSGEIPIYIILKGCRFNFGAKELMSKYSANTPAELIKSLFLAGEIIDISRRIEQLSGYRQMTISEVKND